MRQYEYRTEFLTQDSNLKTLNELGRQGWLVVASLGKDQDGDQELLLARKVPRDMET